MAEKELINEIKEEKPEMTIGEILLFINGINCVLIADALSKGKEVKEDPRKYRNIISGEYARIEKDTLKNLCTFLGVSTDLVLNGLCEHMEPKVYIHYPGIWITFDEYIMFRSINAIRDRCVFVTDDNTKETYLKRIEHDLLLDRCSWLDLYGQNYVDQFRDRMMRGLITIYTTSDMQLVFPIRFKADNKFKEKYDKIIKKVFLKYVSEKVFNNCLQKVQMEKITKKLNVDVDFNKTAFSYNDLIQIVNACMEQNLSNNSDSVKEKSIENNSTNDKTVKVDPSESNQDTADNNDDSGK